MKKNSDVSPSTWQVKARILEHYIAQGQTYGLDSKELTALLERQKDGKLGPAEGTRLHHIVGTLNKISHEYQAAEAVKRKMIVTYGLNPEHALIPFSRYDGREVSREIKTSIEDYLDSARWESQCAEARWRSNSLSVKKDKQGMLNKIVADFMWSLTEGIALRNAHHILKDDFYSQQFTHFGQERKVQEDLANIYINHLTKAALATFATFGFDKEAALFLTGKTIQQAVMEADKYDIEIGTYIDPQAVDIRRSSRLAAIENYGKERARILQDTYDAFYPPTTLEREQEATKARERSRTHREMYPTWYEKEEVRRQNAAKHNTKTP